MCRTPSTPETALAYVLDRLDLILVMTVNPGFGGQAFIPAMVEKVRRIKSMIGNRPIDIEIDGGYVNVSAPKGGLVGAHYTFPKVSVGATHVRFLFGFPFALLFLAGVTAVVSALDQALRNPLWNLRSAAVPLLLGLPGGVGKFIQQVAPMVTGALHGKQTIVDTAGQVERFQKRKGLAVDGVVGPQTWAAMHFAEEDRKSVV